MEWPIMISGLSAAEGAGCPSIAGSGSFMVVMIVRSAFWKAAPAPMHYATG
jgi:hypothetical protein